MMFVVNSQVTYVELEENDVNRRYILPNFENVDGKILAVIHDNPKVHLVRTGYATILSAPDMNVETIYGLQSIPSAPSAMYTIQMNSHAVLGNAQATARYSEEFAQIVGSAQPITAQTQVAIAAPAEPKVDLTTQLRAQMLTKKVEELNVPSVPSVPTEPAIPSVPVSEPLPGQMKFEDFVAQKKAEKVAQEVVSKPAVNRALSPQPTGKIDILMSMVSDLTEEVEELRLMLSEIRSGLGV